MLIFLYRIFQFFYYVFWKLFFKKIIYLITGKHEIERILYSIKNPPYEKYKNLLYYFKNSNSLKKQVLLFFKSPLPTLTQIKDFTSEISKIKKIKNPNFQTKLEEILQKGSKINEYKCKLKDFYERQVDKNNKNHMQLLYDIWNKFFPDDPKIEEIDNKWMKLGFQQKEPLTDFRGAGLLGLMHLHYFCMFCSNAENVYKVATDQKTWYFFAAVSICITGKTIQFIEENDNCNEIFLENQKFDIYKFSQSFHDYLLVMFNDYWVQGNYTDFMMVNALIEEIYNREKMNILYKIKV